MLSLKLLGPPLLVDSEQNVLRLGRRAMSVLAYIVLHARPTVSRQSVAGSIWPALADERAKGNLRRELHAIRASHPVLSKAIVSGRTDIQLVITDYLRVDTWQFEHTSESLDSEPHTTTLLREAAEYLCGLDPVLLHGFEYDWLEVLRTRFEENFLTTTDKLVDCLCVKNLTSTALKVIEKQLAVNTLRDSTYLCKMRLLANKGDTALAIKTYEDCEAHFLTELGVKPNSELRRVHAELLVSGGTDSSNRKPRYHSSILTNEQAVLSTVGRQRELLSIRRFVTGRKDDRCALVLVRGISGIGKSHLLEEAVGTLKSEHYTCLVTQCNEYCINQPFAILAQLLQQFDQSMVNRALSSPCLDEVLSVMPAIGQMKPAALPSGQRSRSRFFKAIGQLIHRSGERIVIVVDDVQWLDPDSEAWLTAFVAKLPPASRVVILFAERIVDGRNSDRKWLEKSLSNCHLLELTLEPLDASEAYHLYLQESKTREAEFVSSEKSPGLATALELYSLTGGRPQLIIELARHEGIVHSDPNLDADPEFSLIGQLATERIQALSSDAVSVIEVVSIVNGPFQWKMLASLCAVDDEHVLVLLEELWRNNLLKVTQAGEYELAHPFYQKILMQMMSPPRQTFHHSRLAKFYRQEVESGHHHLAGLVAVHSLAAADRISAFSWFKVAAEHAERSMAHEDAIAFCEKARSILPELGGTDALIEEEINLLLLQVRQACVLEGYASPAVKTLCQSILKCSHSILNTNLSHDVNKQIRVLYTFGNKPRKARAAGFRQIADAESCGDLVLQIEAWRCKGVAEFQIGRFVDCEASMTKAIDLADRAIALGAIESDKVPFFVTVACNFRALMQYIQDRPMDGAASLALGQNYRGRHADIFSRYLLSITLANVYQLLGNTSEVRVLALQLQTLADEYHLPKMACIASYFNGWVVARDGDAKSGLEQITAAIEAFPKTADHHLFPFWWSYKAELELASGELDRAYHSIQKALAASRYTRQGVWVAEQFRLLALIKGSLKHDASECQHALSCSLRVAQKQQAALFCNRALSVRPNELARLCLRPTHRLK